MTNFSEKPNVGNTNEDSEARAESELNALLKDLENSFLTEIEVNRRAIEEADSSKKALEFAKNKISERILKATDFSEVKTIEGVLLKNVDLMGLYKNVKSILENQVEIGRGKNAFVVIDKNEVRELPPEICYKFLFKERKKKGLLTPREEAEVQGNFYDVITNHERTHFGVPMPFYSIDIATHRMIAMEKLDAVSFEDLARGEGKIPEWFDLDEFCEDLEQLLDDLHEFGMYHRDLHEGNVMLAQKSDLEEGDKWGFLIDFGHAGVAMHEENAYRKERHDEVFTYQDDYGIIKKIKKIIMSRQQGK